MQKAIFFEEALKKGLLNSIEAGYIMSVVCPDIANVSKKLEPYRFEMISYAGLKSVISFEEGVKFQAQGRKMYCMIEPYAYTMSHVEPTYRPQSSTGHMPFRFNNCKTFLTRNNKFRILIPDVLQDCYDSFTVSLPHKGDLCILYYIFDKDIDGVVLPFIGENMETTLKSTLRIPADDARKIARIYIETISKYDVWEGKDIG